MALQAILADAQALGVNAIACSKSVPVIMISAGQAVLYSVVRHLLKIPDDKTGQGVAILAKYMHFSSSMYICRHRGLLLRRSMQKQHFYFAKRNTDLKQHPGLHLNLGIGSVHCFIYDCWLRCG